MKERKTVTLVQESQTSGAYASVSGRAVVSVRRASLVTIVLTGWFIQKFHPNTVPPSMLYEGQLGIYDVQGSLTLRRLVQGQKLEPILNESYAGAYVSGGNWSGAEFWDAGPRVIFEATLGAEEEIEIIQTHGQPAASNNTRDLTPNQLRAGYASGGAQYNLVVMAEADCEPGLTVGCSTGFMRFLETCSGCG